MDYIELTPEIQESALRGRVLQCESDFARVGVDQMVQQAVIDDPGSSDADKALAQTQLDALTASQAQLEIAHAAALAALSTLQTSIAAAAVVVQ